MAARSADMDALGANTSLDDFATFAADYVSGAPAHPEADFDASGGPIGLGDLAIFAREFLSRAHGTYCP